MVNPCSVRQLSNGGESLYLTQTYDPYGTVYTSAGTGASSFGWAGEQVDGNGLVYLRARYYQPGVGRFLNVDPSRQEVNLYGYAGSNPLMYTDPSGLQGIPTDIPQWFLTACAAAGFTPIPGDGVVLCGATALVFVGAWVYASSPAAQDAIRQIVSGCADAPPYPGKIPGAPPVNTPYPTVVPEIPTPYVGENTRVTENIFDLEPIYQATPDPRPDSEPVSTPFAPIPVPTPKRKTCDPNAVRAWMAGLESQSISTNAAWHQYQIRVSGPVEYLAIGGGATIWADGIDANTCRLLEAKYASNLDNHPYHLQSGPIHGQFVGEVKRYAAIVHDPSTPIVGLEIRTNATNAQVYFGYVLTSNGLTLNNNGFVSVIP